CFVGALDRPATQRARLSTRRIFVCGAQTWPRIPPTRVRLALPAIGRRLTAGPFSSSRVAPTDLRGRTGGGARTPGLRARPTSGGPTGPRESPHGRPRARRPPPARANRRSPPPGAPPLGRRDR